MTRNIYAVAEMAGVSTSTVSRALRGDPRIRQSTRERVELAAATLHYVPQAAAQKLAGGSVRALGVVLPRIGGTYYAQLAVGFETRASELDTSVLLLLANPDTDQRAAVQRLMGQVDGVAFMAMSAATDELVSRMAARMPVVTVARTKLPGVPAIYAESRASAEELTTHLISLGRTRLVFVGQVDPGSDIEARYEGFCAALCRAELPIPPALGVAMDEYTGRGLARDMVAGGLEYDALVCGNDEIAVALVHEMQELGIDVPRQISVVGWDDIRASRYLRPGLTTVSQPVAQLGAMAAEQLHRLMAGERADESVVLPTTIVHRQSCGCGVLQPFTTQRGES
ncbi:LacI family DNA-binding transcriptional regulator [Tessaracoccus antarcticus]|uniref:LacI family transcriptional regulator n=1 Tax=Tessaracoccus antarcticus TaxID=2479848 RepID=A0A3M0G6K2_9ACTN|nr:LacI family DNA-binding transcriptional regulator [Tessaracoccus antarcticus]RMB59727.1 LacI family transcriptional regulator [Tessaracoccus antarcticus]